MTSRHSRRSAGFTLLEMLVVLALLGLALALVAQDRGPGPAMRMRAAADAVAAALRTARGRAILTDRRITVALDAPMHVLHVQGGPSLNLPAALDVTGTRTIGFAPDGSSSGGRIVLAGGGRRRAVAIDWLTGRVSTADIAP